MNIIMIKMATTHIFLFSDGRLWSQGVGSIAHTFRRSVCASGTVEEGWTEDSETGETIY